MSDAMRNTPHMLAREAMGVPLNGECPEPWLRVARRSVRTLQRMGLLEVIEVHGRGRRNIFIPHRLASAIEVASGLVAQDVDVQAEWGCFDDAVAGVCVSAGTCRHRSAVGADISTTASARAPRQVPR